MHTQEGKKELISINDEIITIRELLIRYSNEALKKDTYKWVDLVISDILKDTNKKYVITDWRRIEEFERLKDYKITTIRINRDIYNKIESTYDMESILDNFSFDYIIDNNGRIEDLKEKIDKLI
jgi:hypothetical protein